mmetsp:Transcript_3809/g.8210  ORF Transcript_3809/g.8210 Transcript_3809/m.8210 type:complete len:398 (+) Transcript_3809:440-1633(+)
MGINIRVGIGNLSVFLQDIRHDLVNGVDNLEQFVIGHVLHSKISLACVSRIGLSQNGVAVSGDNLLGVQSFPSKFGNSFGCDFLSFGFKFGLEVLNPLEDFLVGQTVKRSGKCVQSTGIGKVRIRKGGSNQMSSVCRCVSSLVIGVDTKVQSHKLVKCRVVVPKHATEISRIIQRGILRDNTIEVNVSVNHSSNLWQNSNNTQNILERVVVVFGLRHTIRVGFGKFRLGLASIQTNGQLSHRMHILWKTIDQIFDVFGELGTGVKVGSERIDLFLSRHFRRQKQPQKTFQKRFAITGFPGVRGKDGLAFRNRQSTESNTFGRIQVGSFPYHTFHRTGTANTLVDSDFSNNLISVFFLQGPEGFLLLGNLRSQCFLKCGHTSETLSDGNLADELLHAF